MSRQATIDDYNSGKKLFFWGNYYNVLWYDSSKICLCLPGHPPNTWKHIDSSAKSSVRTSVVLPLNSPQILVMD